MSNLPEDRAIAHNPLVQRQRCSRESRYGGAHFNIVGRIAFVSKTIVVVDGFAAEVDHSQSPMNTSMPMNRDDP